MSGVLVITEQRRGELRPASLELIAAAPRVRQEGDAGVAVAAIGPAPEKHVAALSLEGVDEIITVKTALPEFDPETFEGIVAALIAERRPDVVLVPHSIDAFGYAAALAAKLSLGFATDVFDVRREGGALVATRGGYGQKVAVEVDFPGRSTVLLALRGNAFKAPEQTTTPRGNAFETPGQTPPSQGNAIEAPKRTAAAPRGDAFEAPEQAPAPRGNAFETPGQTPPRPGNAIEAPEQTAAPQGNAVKTPPQTSAPRITAFDAPPIASRSQPREFIELPAGDDVDMTTAAFILSIGRGIGEEAKVAQFRELADAIGATLGCSRPIADAGWLPKSRQVGQSGKTASACRLYIAMGVSGAIQHLAGMKHVSTIVAVNSDPNASIFGVATFGVVADIFDVADELRRLF
jgi:electron transfer flavoprotein alpha subunit